MNVLFEEITKRLPEGCRVIDEQLCIPSSDPILWVTTDKSKDAQPFVKTSLRTKTFYITIRKTRLLMFIYDAPYWGWSVNAEWDIADPEFSVDIMIDKLKDFI